MMTPCCVQIPQANPVCSAVAAIDADRWETVPFRLRVPIPCSRDIPKMPLPSTTRKFPYPKGFCKLSPKGKARRVHAAVSDGGELPSIIDSPLAHLAQSRSRVALPL